MGDQGGNRRARRRAGLNRCPMGEILTHAKNPTIFVTFAGGGPLTWRIHFLWRLPVDLLKALFGPGVPGVSAQEAHTQLSAPKPPLVLDVRQPEEFREVRLPQAKLIPLGELNARLNELPKDRAILCVCRSGNRSGSAARMLMHAGYNVINLRGGLLAWEMAGLPTQRGK